MAFSADGKQHWLAAIADICAACHGSWVLRPWPFAKHHRRFCTQVMFSRTRLDFVVTGRNAVCQLDSTQGCELVTAAQEILLTVTNMLQQSAALAGGFLSPKIAGCVPHPYKGGRLARCCCCY
jgi:hypothetical protein